MEKMAPDTTATGNVSTKTSALVSMAVSTTTCISSEVPPSQAQSLSQTPHDPAAAEVLQAFKDHICEVTAPAQWVLELDPSPLLPLPQGIERATKFCKNTF